MNHAFRTTALPLTIALAIALPTCADEPAPTRPDDGGAPAQAIETCIDCHASEENLKATTEVSGAPEIGRAPAVAGCQAGVPALEPWEKVIITGANAELFFDSPHGRMSCQYCHGGKTDHSFKTKAEAHTGLVRDPSAIGKCDACHRPVANAYAKSLHANLWGERNSIERRGRVTLAGSPYESHFEGACGSCHATCGQCHVSRPNSVGGGFPKIGTYSSHLFRATPDMSEQCAACHGSTVGPDFTGTIEGNLPDVHGAAGYRCENCHTRDEIHGDGRQPGDHYEHRYQVESMPRCEQCHTPGSNIYHDVHVAHPGRNLQCQVCHSQAYQNCTNCHGLDGGPEIDAATVQLKIAHNPNPERGEYDYAIVRHVPVAPDTYADWGLALPGYLDSPTWVYASPHNIQRWTPQTTVKGRYCYESCHRSPSGPAGFFLRESDLYESDGLTKLPDYDANIGIVIREDD